MKHEYNTHSYTPNQQHNKLLEFISPTRAQHKMEQKKYTMEFIYICSK